MNNEVELDFLRQGQKSFSNSDAYWIGGSVNAEHDTDISYSDYLDNESGSERTRGVLELLNFGQCFDVNTLTKLVKVTRNVLVEALTAKF